MFDQVELEQLQARFPGDSCTLLEKSHDSIAYSIKFQPSDPEWVSCVCKCACQSVVYKSGVCRVCELVMSVRVGQQVGQERESARSVRVGQECAS